MGHSEVTSFRICHFFAAVHNSDWTGVGHMRCGELKRNLYYHTNMATDIPAEEMLILMHMHLGLLPIDGMPGQSAGEAV